MTIHWSFGTSWGCSATWDKTATGLFCTLTTHLTSLFAKIWVALLSPRTSDMEAGYVTRHSSSPPLPLSIYGGGRCQAEISCRVNEPSTQCFPFGVQGVFVARRRPWNGTSSPSIYDAAAAIAYYYIANNMPDIGPIKDRSGGGCVLPATFGRRNSLPLRTARTQDPSTITHDVE